MLDISTMMIKLNDDFMYSNDGSINDDAMWSNDDVMWLYNMIQI